MKIEKTNEFNELNKKVIENGMEVTPIELPQDTRGLEKLHSVKDGVSFRGRDSICMCATCIYCPSR